MGRDILNDKYRPNTLKDLSFNKDVNGFLIAVAKRPDMPHLIIEGPRGSGKRLRVELYLREKFGDLVINSRTLNLELPGKSETKAVHTLYSRYHHQFNPSIHNIYDRSLMQCFINEIVHTRLLFNIPYKIIVVEDADMLSTEAQESLRRTLETCVRTCRFVFLVNNEDRIIPAIYSRCISVKLAAPTIDEIVTIMTDICQKEGSDLKDKTLRGLAMASGRNLRKAINMLNMLLLTNKPIFSRMDYDNVYRYCVNIVDNIIKGKTIVSAMEKVRGLLYELVNFCVDCKSLLPIILDIIVLKLPDNAYNERFELTRVAAERDRSIRSSSKDIYHIESFCLYVLKTVKVLMLTKQRQTPKIEKK